MYCSQHLRASSRKLDLPLGVLQLTLFLKCVSYHDLGRGQFISTKKHIKSKIWFSGRTWKWMAPCLAGCCSREWLARSGPAFLPRGRGPEPHCETSARVCRTLEGKYSQGEVEPWNKGGIFLSNYRASVEGRRMANSQKQVAKNETSSRKVTGKVKMKKNTHTQ